MDADKEMWYQQRRRCTAVGHVAAHNQGTGEGGLARTQIPDAKWLSLYSGSRDRTFAQWCNKAYRQRRRMRTLKALMSHLGHPAATAQPCHPRALRRAITPACAFQGKGIAA